MEACTKQGGIGGPPPAPLEVCDYTLHVELPSGYIDVFDEGMAESVANLLVGDKTDQKMGQVYVQKPTSLGNSLQLQLTLQYVDSNSSYVCKAIPVSGALLDNNLMAWISLVIKEELIPEINAIAPYNCTCEAASQASFPQEYSMEMAWAAPLFLGAILIKKFWRKA